MNIFTSDCTWARNVFMLPLMCFISPTVTTIFIEHHLPPRDGVSLMHIEGYSPADLAFECFLGWQDSHTNENCSLHRLSSTKYRFSWAHNSSKKPLATAMGRSWLYSLHMRDLYLPPYTFHISPPQHTITETYSLSSQLKVVQSKYIYRRLKDARRDSFVVPV